MMGQTASTVTCHRCFDFWCLTRRLTPTCLPHMFALICFVSQKLSSPTGRSTEVKLAGILSSD